MNLKKLITKTFVKQQEQTDCGIACLRSLINYYGGVENVEILRRLTGINTQGVTLLGLYQAANKIGFIARGYEANISSLIEQKNPVILHVISNENLNHFVICYGYKDEKFIIGDPAEGVVYLSKEELNKIWVSKACLVIVPSSKFINKKNEVLEKYRWFISIIKHDKKPLFVSSIIGLCVAILGMTMAIFSQKLIDDILPSKRLDKLLFGTILFTLLLIIKSILNRLRSYILINQNKIFNNRIINRFYHSLISLPNVFFESRNSGELAARLNDTQRIQKVITMIASNTVIDLFIVLTSILVIFFYSYVVGLVALLSIPIYILIILFFKKDIIKAQKLVMHRYAQSESNYITTIQGIFTIKSNNRISFFRNKNKNIFGLFQESIMSLGKINIKLEFIIQMLSIIFLVGILSYTSFLVFENKKQIGELVAIIGIFSSLLPSILSLILIVIPISEAKVAFDRMYELISQQSEESGKFKLSEFKKLTVSKVSFRYPGQSILFENISLNLSKGECIALVGESGCGKSSFINGLMKLNDFESGSVFINEDINLLDIDIKSWRNIVNIVPQNVTIFDGSVIYNILLGEQENIENIKKFVVDYGFDSFINTLPQGLFTLLGKQGIMLSGGQKQIVALMRALYRRPQLLILDEFTSNMDNKTEFYFLKVLNKIKLEMSIIYITHRCYSIKDIADCIYIFENKTISCYGTHEQLLCNSNLYSDYWNKIFKY